MSDESNKGQKSRFEWEPGDFEIIPADEVDEEEEEAEGEAAVGPAVTPVLSELFGLPVDVESIVLNLVAEIIEHAASLGSNRWGLTDYKPYMRVNVGWTEIITTFDDGVRLIVDGDLAVDADPEEKIILDAGEKEKGYYPSIEGSLLALLPFEPLEEFSQAVEVLRPAVRRAIEISAKRPTPPAIRKAHSDEKLRALSAAVGRELPKPEYPK